MSKTDTPAKPMVVITEKGLRPLTGFDAEDLMGFPKGTQFELHKLSKRKPAQHRTYWKALSLVVKSTGRWATTAHLHDELKIACGYYRVTKSLTSPLELILPDSTAWDKMEQDQWQEYMNKAMEVLANAVGFDPLAFLGHSE